MRSVLSPLVLGLAAICAGPGMALGQGPVLPLEEAVRLAVGSHPTVAAAHATVAGARSSAREAEAALWPQLRLDASATRFEEPMVVAPLHGIDPQSPPLFDETLVQVSVGLSYTLLDGGRRGAAVRREAAGIGIREADARSAIQRVILAVSQAWLGVSAGRQQVAAEDRRLEALLQEADRVAQLLAVGRAAPIAQIRVAAAMAEAEAARVARAEELDRQVVLLARLTGLTAEAVRAATLLPVQPARTLPDPGLAGDALHATNPDLVRARARVQATRAAADAAASSWWPEVRLQGGYTDYSSGAGRLTGEWHAGVRAGYALFTGGARTASTARARHERDAATAELAAVEIELSAAADRVLAGLRTARARSAALASAVRQHEEVARIERLALDVGTGIQADWLEAEAALLASRSALIDARHGEVLARLELARLAGGLTPEAIPTLVEIVP